MPSMYAHGINNRATHMVKFEAVCIRRRGLNLKKTEGIDAAAKVTYRSSTPGEVCDPSVGIRSELLIPRLYPWRFE
jgi:hypothetical protein